MKKDLLRILRCPECKKDGLAIVEAAAAERSVVNAPASGGLKCHFCGAGYRIENGIVVFVEENAPGASRRSGTDY
ncbi:MAG: hypothetical protein CVU77_03195 [Elusimicrobia bacterium HGW-Elusimicrobia-1]|jgi:uncharacterized protein YbaR (Trm112 family)|nr:MAG: hypothetical protein CVU77_03195 [Elusimicrobia bacterium HGW-Elusimicrobia-1]